MMTESKLDIEHDVTRLQQAVGHQRDVMRSVIVCNILKADKPNKYIHTLIQTLILSALPGRLDDGIDILSQCEHLVEQLLYEMLLQPQSSEIDEDYWYILISSIENDKSLKHLSDAITGDSLEFVRNLIVVIIKDRNDI